MRFAHPGMTALAFEQLVGDDLDAEARKTLVVVHRGGEMPDRGDVEIAQDLCTDADFTPLPGAVSLGRALIEQRLKAPPGRNVAQIDQTHTARCLELLEHRRHALVA